MGIKKGALKIKAHIKGALKVKAPKAKINLKVKAPKVGLKAKVGGKASLKVKAPKAKLGVKAKVGGKASLKVKAKKDRRLQAPAAPVAPATPAGPQMTTSKDGLAINAYSSDIAVPADLSGDSDQTAPDSSNLLKLAFATFAMLLTMF